jgi:hypothetical protein
VDPPFAAAAHVFCDWAMVVEQRAIEIVQKAIDEDVNQNYPEAYKQYQNALDYFMMALKCAFI